MVVIYNSATNLLLYSERFSGAARCCGKADKFQIHSERCMVSSVAFGRQVDAVTKMITGLNE